MRKRILGVTGMISFVFLLGTTGGLENDTLTIGQFIFWFFIFSLICGTCLNLGGKYEDM